MTLLGYMELRMKKFIKYVFILISLGLFLNLCILGFKTKYFNVNEISIKGKNEIIKNDIVQKLNSIKGKNLIYINSKKLEKNLKYDPRVESVDIKKIYPDKLVIEINEKTPYVFIRNNDKFHLADKNLVIYGNIDEIQNVDIPIVNNDTSTKLEDFKTILSKIEYEELYKSISEIRKNGVYYEVVLKDGVIIRTDKLVEEKKYETSFKLYKKLKNQQPMEYIDIRYKDVNVKLIGTLNVAPKIEPEVVEVLVKKPAVTKSVETKNKKQ